MFVRVIGFVFCLVLVLTAALASSGQQLLLDQRFASPESLGASAKAAFEESQLLLCRYLGARGAQVVVVRFDPTNQMGVGHCPLLRSSVGPNPLQPRARG